MAVPETIECFPLVTIWIPTRTGIKALLRTVELFPSLAFGRVGAGLAIASLLVSIVLLLFRYVLAFPSVKTYGQVTRP